MLRFVTFAIKTQLNVHDLNNEAVAGNVLDIRIMDFLDENGERQEAPAVSGRMLKHWHYEGIKHSIVNGPYATVPLCAGCKAGEPIRPSEMRDGKLIQVAKSEQDAITSCAVCDVHGYLIAQEAKKEEQEGKEEDEEKDEKGIADKEKTEKGKEKGKRERGISARRSSRAMFSWLMPVLDKKVTSKQVIHNRVSSDPKVMMPFNKSYASGFYGFVSILDADRIGLVELNLGSDKPYAVDNKNGRKDRIKVAIEAYRYLISGQMGASLSHAVPHANPIEMLVAYSEHGPLPFPVSPMYSDYISKTKGLMPKNTTFLYWGSETPAEVNKKNTIDDIFTELLSKVG
jgi:CRISPR-associated protein Cst2